MMPALGSVIFAVLVGWRLRPKPVVRAAAARRRQVRRWPWLVFVGIAISLSPVLGAAIAFGGALGQRWWAVRGAALSRRQTVAAFPMLSICWCCRSAPATCQRRRSSKSSRSCPCRCARRSSSRRGDAPWRSVRRRSGRLPALLGPVAQPLVDSLSAADRYGLPLAPVLERLALEARQQRRRDSDATARQLPVRLAHAAGGVHPAVVRPVRHRPPALRGPFVVATDTTTLTIARTGVSHETMFLLLHELVLAGRRRPGHHRVRPGDARRRACRPARRGWATGGGGAGKIGNLFDRVIDSGHRQVLTRPTGARPPSSWPCACRCCACCCSASCSWPWSSATSWPCSSPHVRRARRGGAATAAAAAEAGAAQAISLRPLTVTASSSASAVTVTVSHVTPTDVPLIGALLPDVTVTATATMALEPP